LDVTDVESLLQLAFALPVTDYFLLQLL
jgi:hypothetical protein